MPLPLTLRLAVAYLLSSSYLFHHVAATTALAYCSDINTSTNAKNTSIFQSNGLCTDFCEATYAFAVLQDNGCWCSNYAPASTDTGCTTSCPGYPDDICGGTGVYGYLALNLSPSGTEGASSSAAAATTSKPTTTSAASVSKVTIISTASAVVTVTNAPADTTETTSASSSTSSKTTTTSDTTNTPTTSTTTSSTSSTWTPTPVTSLQTVTGQVRTVTVTPTVPPTSQNSDGIVSSKKGSGGIDTGGAVGLTVGLLALVAIVASIIYFCLRKRKQEKAAKYNDMSRRGSTVGLGGPVPSRTMSENSRYILGTDGRQVIETWEDGNQPGTRKSRLMPVDPRLDPYSPVYQRGENAKSRESINTIRDDHDYSRRVHHGAPILRATNPDTD